MVSVGQRPRGYPLVWEPKSPKVCFWDTEEDTLRKMGTWEEFIAEPGKMLDHVIVWAQPL